MGDDFLSDKISYKALSESDLDSWSQSLGLNGDKIQKNELKNLAWYRSWFRHFAAPIISKSAVNFASGAGAGAAVGAFVGAGIGAGAGAAAGAFASLATQVVYQETSKHYSYQYDFIYKFLNNFDNLKTELENNKHYQTEQGKEELKNLKLLNVNEEKQLTTDQLKQLIEHSNYYAYSKLTALTKGAALAYAAVSGAAHEVLGIEPISSYISSSIENVVHWAGGSLAGGSLDLATQFSEAATANLAALVTSKRLKGEGVTAKEVFLSEAATVASGEVMNFAPAITDWVTHFSDSIAGGVEDRSPNHGTDGDPGIIRRLTEVGGSGSEQCGIVVTLDDVYDQVRSQGMDAIQNAHLKEYLKSNIEKLHNPKDCEKWLYILFKSHNGESGLYKDYENHDNDLCRGDIEGTKNLLEIIYKTPILKKLVEHHEDNGTHPLCNHYNQIRSNVGNPHHTQSITRSDEGTFVDKDIKDAKAAFCALLDSIKTDKDGEKTYWNIEKYSEFKDHLDLFKVAKKDADDEINHLKDNLADAHAPAAPSPAAPAHAPDAHAPAAPSTSVSSPFLCAAFGAGAAATTTAFALKSCFSRPAPTASTAVQVDCNFPFVKIQDNSPAIGIIKNEGEKKVFYKGNINETDITKVKNIHSYIYAEGKEVVNGILKKEVNIVRHNDMGYLIIKDKRLEDKDISIKIDFSGEKPTLSLINQEGQIIGINYEVKEILNSITINIHDKVETKNVTVKNIAGETEAKEITNPEDNINRINREINELQQSQSLQSFGGTGISR